MRLYKSFKHHKPGEWHWFSMMRNSASALCWHYFINDEQHNVSTEHLVLSLPALAEMMKEAEMRGVGVWLRTGPTARSEGVNPGLWAGDRKGPGLRAEKLGYVKVADLVETLTFHIHMLEG